MDLSSLDDDGLFKRAKKNFKDGLALFLALLSSLPEGDMVFIIIDSTSQLSGSETDSDKLIKELRCLIRNEQDLALKVMVTGALPGSYVKEKADTSLYIPDVVGGFGAFDITEGVDDIARMVNQKRGVEDSGGESTSDDENDDDDSSEDGHSDSDAYYQWYLDI